MRIKGTVLKSEYFLTFKIQNKENEHHWFSKQNRAMQKIKSIKQRRRYASSLPGHVINRENYDD